MLDVSTIATRLSRGEDGIWYAAEDQVVSYPAQGNDNCYAVEDASFWFSHRNRCIQALVRAFPPPGRGPIFDIGGGNGVVSRGLETTGFEVVLVEPGKTGAVNARSRGLEHVICATTETAGFNAGSIPAVGLFDVIEHIEDDRGFLQQVHRLLIDGGRLYATVPAFASLWSHQDELAGHYRRYSREEICEVLRTAGFEVEFSTYIFRILPLPIALLRALPYRLGLKKKPRTRAEISRDHGANGGLGMRVMRALLQPEVARIESIRPMSFGGSCLLVARAKPAGVAHPDPS
jgi:SAM-dependent methyltransferase